MEKINRILWITLIISLLVLLIIETSFFTDSRVNYLSYFADVVMAIIIGSIVAIALNKYILKEQQIKQLEVLKVSQNVYKSGFEEYYPTFDQIDLKNYLRNSKNVQIYVTYGDRVIGSLSNVIREKLKSFDFNIEIFISDKQNPFLETYGKLWQKDTTSYDIIRLVEKIDAVTSEIRAIKIQLEKEKALNGSLNLYSVKYHPVSFSFYRFDEEIIFVPNKLVEKKYPDMLPCFKFKNTLDKKDMFSWVKWQLEFITDPENNAIKKVNL